MEDDINYEQFIYLFRIPIILVSLILVAFLIYAAIPEIDPAWLKADALAGNIAYDQKLFIAPGYLTEQTWNSYNPQYTNYASQVGAQPIGALITLSIPQEEPQYRYVHQQSFGQLALTRSLKSVETYYATLPVTYAKADNTLLVGNITIEVLVGK